MTDKVSATLSRLRPNARYFALHAAAVAIAFVGMIGFIFQDSPRFDVYAATPSGKIWEGAGNFFALASLFGIPALAVGSVVATLKGKVQAGRYMCWASLGAALGLLLSAIAIVSGA